MSEKVRSIPRPLVRTNQSVIVLCGLLTLFFGQFWCLLIPFIAGLLGLIFGFNPIMRFASLFLRKDRKMYIPEDWEQQQFNQTIAVFCLGLGFLGFFMRWNAIGYIFTILVTVAAFVAILGFCVGCFIHYQWKMYIYKRSKKTT